MSRTNGEAIQKIADSDILGAYGRKDLSVEGCKALCDQESYCAGFQFYDGGCHWKHGPLNIVNDTHGDCYVKTSTVCARSC